MSKSTKEASTESYLDHCVFIYNPHFFKNILNTIMSRLFTDINYLA